MLGHEAGCASLSCPNVSEDALVVWLNRTTCRQAWSRRLVALAARWLAAVEIGLMAILALGGRRQAFIRMLAAVGIVYAASEAAGVAWPRLRPFARISGIEPLVEHASGRSFPSRHVASGLAMAAIGGGSHPTLGLVMSVVAWALGTTRVAAGLHYPSDVLGGAALGLGIGGLLRQRQ
jgi:undecaprenyl-diphosphatase